MQRVPEIAIANRRRGLLEIANICRGLPEIYEISLYQYWGITQLDQQFMGTFEGYWTSVK